VKERLKDNGQVKENPFHRLLPKKDSQKINPLKMHLFARQNKERLECACSGLVLHEINDYLYQYIYEQWLMLLLTKSMMAKQSKDLYHSSIKHKEQISIQRSQLSFVSYH
jgi:hypothetical protein